MRMPAFSLEQAITLIMMIVGTTAWMIRLEGKVKAGTAAHARLASDLVQFYVTKQELAKVEGQLSALGVSVANVEKGVDRMERKLDALVASGLLNGGGTNRTTVNTHPS